MTEYTEGLDAGGAEIRIEIAGTVPGVAADSRRARGANPEIFLAVTGEVGAVDVCGVGTGVLRSAKISSRSCRGDG